MIYEFEYRIQTLAKNVGPIENLAGGFAVMDVSFSHWDFSLQDGWKGHHWLATGRVEAPNYLEAYEQFYSKLGNIIPKISLVAQCYIDFLVQPFLIRRSDNNVAFFRFVRDRGATGLMFTETQQAALTTLLESTQVPEAFYYYWNDAVNSTGYSSKLLLMFSAIEALVKTSEGKKDFAKLEEILGEDLKTALWGTQENGGKGALRHRLVHGEYFNPNDSGTNYLDLVHKKVISYFNRIIFGENLISESIVNPQRHPFGNKVMCGFFIRAKGSKNLSLKDIFSDIQRNSIDQMENYQSVYDEDLTKDY